LRDAGGCADRKNILCRAAAPLCCRDELPEDDADNPDAAAIKAIMEDTTPEESAEGFKVCRVSGG